MSAPVPANTQDIENEADDISSKKGFLAFIGTMSISILIILFFFAIGSVFLSQANFYSRYKMDGRFENGPPYTTQFPYKNLFTETDDDSWPYRFGRWLTQSLITAFANNRFLLDKFLDYTGKGLKDAPGFVSTLVMVFGPLIVLILVVLSYFGGIISSLMGSLAHLVEVVPTMLELFILALPLGIPLLVYPFFILFSAGLLGLGVGISQAAMMIGFLVILPLMDAGVRQGIINTLIDNKYIILLCIFSVMTFNAFGMLGKTPGYISLGIAIASLLTYIYMKIL